MGTLLIIKGFRRKILPSENDHLCRFPVLVFVITLMIGIQVPMMSCSGGVNLARPYLFRDYEMLADYGPQQHSSSSHGRHHVPLSLFHQQKNLPSYSAESTEDSEEGEETQYTAPLILDIDDPEVRARWMGLGEQTSFEEDEDEEYYEDYEEQPRSLSSTEFSSRSSQQIGPSEEKQNDKSNGGSSSSTSGTKSGDNNAAEKESNRGIMENFNFNPFSFWQGESEDDQGVVGDELPQSDETPEYSYYPLAYDATPQDYYFDPQQDDDQETSIMPQLVPMQLSAPPPKPKPKPKPVLKQKMKKPKPPKVYKPKPPKAPKPKPAKAPKPKPPKKSKPKPPKKSKLKPPKKSKPRPKPMPKPMPPMMKPRPYRRKKKVPQDIQQYHYEIEFSKPDKLSTLTEKLSKLNPFRYVQIQKPQITVQKHDPPPRPPPAHGGWPPPAQGGWPPPAQAGWPPPPMKRKKPKRKPKPPKRKKMKGKPHKAKPKRKPSGKPHEDEHNPEYVMYLGEPYGGRPFEGHRDPVDYRDGQDDGEEADDDDEEEEEEDEEDDGDEDDDEDLPQVTSITHGQLSSGEMTNGEAELSGDDGEAELSGDDGEADTETDHTQLVEDDEGDYEEGGIGPTSNRETSDGTDAETRQDDVDQKEKSIGFSKLFGWKKKKRRRRRPHKSVPARKPPNWKQYRPAPLLPEFPEQVSDAILKVVKHVGFLPEYDVAEKYGGHNKIKGKFTKTRPITLHHGLLTEVVRRR